MSRSLFVLQGGGPTAVINATLAGIAEDAGEHFDSLLGLRHSFEGKEGEEALDLSYLLNPGENKPLLDSLASTPGALLGSSRKKVEEQDLERVLQQMLAAGSDALIGIGGNGTMAALAMMAEYATANGHDIRVIGAPKTVDNDLPGVYAAPGYGSAARFVSMAVRDFDRDFGAMSTFDDVTIFETMGRNTGWIAAASVLLKEADSAPNIILVPERTVNESALLEKIQCQHAARGSVFIVVNEMLSSSDGGLIGESFQNGPTDSLGRKMYSLSFGTGNYLAHKIWSELGLQSRCLRPGNLGRAMSFCVSEPDLRLARRTGQAAVKAFMGTKGVGHMVTIDSDLEFGLQALRDCTGVRPVPDEFLLPGMGGLQETFHTYARPLIGKVEPLFNLESMR
jgi:6-phosphofructokinase